MIAAGNADLTLCKLLIKKGADANARDAGGRTAARYAYEGVGGRGYGRGGAGGGAGAINAARFAAIKAMNSKEV